MNRRIPKVAGKGCHSPGTPIVAILNNRWRVIECPDGIQWIVQKRAGQRHGRARWDNRKFFRSREALIAFFRALHEDVEPDGLEVLENLPRWMGGGA